MDTPRESYKLTRYYAYTTYNTDMYTYVFIGCDPARVYFGLTFNNINNLIQSDTVYVNQLDSP